MKYVSIPAAFSHNRCDGSRCALYSMLGRCPKPCQGTSRPLEPPAGTQSLPHVGTLSQTLPRGFSPLGTLGRNAVPAPVIKRFFLYSIIITSCRFVLDRTLFCVQHHDYPYSFLLNTSKFKVCLDLWDISWMKGAIMEENDYLNDTETKESLK